MCMYSDIVRPHSSNVIDNFTFLKGKDLKVLGLNIRLSSKRKD